MKVRATTCFTINEKAKMLRNKHVDKGEIIDIPPQLFKKYSDCIEEIKEESKPRIDDRKINLAKEILSDENLFERIAVTEIDKKVVGEIEARKVIVLCGYGGRLVDNSQTASFNLLVNDDAGTGKDYVTGATLELLPKHLCIRKSRISPTVLNYWHNSKDEPQWNWDGKVLYLEDISELILNHDVFKVMCSSGSEASIVIDKKVVELEVKGKPVMICTTATATPNPELVRRFVILDLDSSINQTKEIMKRHSKFREEGIIPIIDEDLKYAQQLLKRVKVKIPFASKIDEHFPSKNIIMRTHYPRFLDFISASAGLHQFQRKTDESGFLLAEGKDYDIARQCFLKLCSNKYMIPLTINQKKILQRFEKEPLLEGGVTELHSKGMNFISDKALRYNLNLLCNYGILESFEFSNSQNKAIEGFRLSGNYKPNEKIVIPTYEELCRITSLPSLPSLPSLTSLPSEHSKKVENNDFLGGREGSEVGNGVLNLQQIREMKQFLEDFKE